jgi:hypothetical protein
MTEKIDKKASSAQQAQNPLILRANRLIDAFAKSDDERDFFLDRKEGFILFADLDKNQEDLELFYKDVKKEAERYVLIPKLTFYETKKIMEGFVNEKVYDIDTKEKLLDIIGSKDAREHFLEFVYDHESELEKWQQYYQERSRVRIIEWLRNHNFQFVFEEDLDLPRTVVESLKMHLFDPKVPKDIALARQSLIAKAKTYYSNEALNPRPKRGRPPKQVLKVETETEISGDIYTTVSPALRRFLYLPDITSASSLIFSEKYDTEEEFLKHLRGTNRYTGDSPLVALSEKLTSLKRLSTQLSGMDVKLAGETLPTIDLGAEDDDEDDEEDEDEIPAPKKRKKK